MQENVRLSRHVSLVPHLLLPYMLRFNEELCEATKIQVKDECCVEDCASPRIG